MWYSPWSGKRAPKIPFPLKRSSEKGCKRHPHGQRVSWFAHPWSAVRTCSSSRKRLGKSPPNSTNLLVSYWSNVSCSMSKSSHCGTTGNSSARIGFGCMLGKGRMLKSGTDASLSTHHHLDLLVGKRESRWRSQDVILKPFCAQKSWSKAATCLSVPAAQTHSKRIVRAPNQWDALRILPKLLALTSWSPFLSPSRDHGWHEKPPLTVKIGPTDAWILEMTSGSPMSPTQTFCWPWRIWKSPSACCMSLDACTVRPHDMRPSPINPAPAQSSTALLVKSSVGIGRPRLKPLVTSTVNLGLVLVTCPWRKLNFGRLGNWPEITTNFFDKEVLHRCLKPRGSKMIMSAWKSTLSPKVKVSHGGSKSMRPVPIFWNHPDDRPAQLYLLEGLGPIAMCQSIKLTMGNPGFPNIWRIAMAWETLCCVAQKCRSLLTSSSQVPLNTLG